MVKQFLNLMTSTPKYIIREKKKNLESNQKEKIRYAETTKDKNDS